MFISYPLFDFLSFSLPNPEIEPTPLPRLTLTPPPLTTQLFSGSHQDIEKGGATADLAVVPTIQTSPAWWQNRPRSSWLEGSQAHNSHHWLQSIHHHSIDQPKSSPLVWPGTSATKAAPHGPLHMGLISTWNDGFLCLSCQRCIDQWPTRWIEEGRLRRQHKLTCATLHSVFWCAWANSDSNFYPFHKFIIIYLFFNGCDGIAV